MRHTATGLVLIMAAAMTELGGAGADVVPPPPKSCPAGSSGKTGHAGPYCAPRTCTADSACRKGERCEPRKLCIKPKTLDGGMPIEGEPPPRVVDEVVGSCEGSSKCAAGSRCKSLRVCMARGSR